MDEYTREKYEALFKLFMRFLKDNGHYPFMKKYLFFRRTKEEFLNDAYNFFKENNSANFGDILHYIPILGKSFKLLGNPYWSKMVRPINDEWKIYFKRHRDKIII